MGLIGEAQRHAESVQVLLQEGISVLTLGKARHGSLELLQPCVKVLLGPPATGQVGLHHLPQCEVVPCICTLRSAVKTHGAIRSKTKSLIRHNLAA